MRRFQRETFLIKINPSNGWLCPRLFYDTVFLQQISSLLFFCYYQNTKCTTPDILN